MNTQSSPYTIPDDSMDSLFQVQAAAALLATLRDLPHGQSAINQVNRMAALAGLIAVRLDQVLEDIICAEDRPSSTGEGQDDAR